jgi:phosphatidylserine/phosphatidylglycerophosphate/cardiolipin synthase-like enzyme
MIKGKQISVICMVSFIALFVAGCSSGGGASNTPQPAGNQPITQEQTPGSAALPPISYYFPRAGQRPDLELINVINSARNNLDIAIYSLTKTNIVNAIVAAEKRGVTVRIITDKEESSSKSQEKELNILSSTGIPIKINSHQGLMHLKVTIADDSTVTTGSYNYTNEATYDNDEVLVIIHSQSMAQDWDSEFGRMWADTADYSNY